RRRPRQLHGLDAIGLGSALGPAHSLNPKRKIQMVTIWRPILGGNGGVEVSDGLEGHIFVSRGAGSDLGPPPDGWNRLDLTQFGIPADAGCVDISGLLIVTMGTTPGFVNGCVAFKRPSDNVSQIRSRYVMQVVGNSDPSLHEGIRTNAATVISPEDGCID